MYAQIEKSKENKSKVAANSAAQKKNVAKHDFELMDNRPEVLAQRLVQMRAAEQTCSVIQLGAFEDNLAVQALKPSIDACELVIINGTLGALTDSQLSTYSKDLKTSIRLRERIQKELGPDSGHAHRILTEQSFLLAIETEITRRQHIAEEEKRKEENDKFHKSGFKLPASSTWGRKK